jgi:hypothetical protein
MKAHLNKFQMMVLQPNGADASDTVTIQVGDICLTSQTKAKLLSVTLDSDLRFDLHVKDMCTNLKANAKLRILKRLSGFPSQAGIILRNFYNCTIGMWGEARWAEASVARVIAF